jgi:hypothetical protein
VEVNGDLFFVQLERLGEQLVFGLEFFALFGKFIPDNFQLIIGKRLVSFGSDLSSRGAGLFLLNF